MKHVYSVQGSKLHLRMDEELANGYNKAIDAFFQAQRDFEFLHGRKVTQEEVMEGKLHIRANEEDVNNYNKVVRFLNKQYANGVTLYEKDLVSDYLELIE